jgi:hypothetical protein
MQALQKIKRFIFILIERLIKIGDRHYSKPKFIPMPLWGIFGRLVFFTGDLGWLLRGLFRAPAFLAGGDNWRIIYIGSETSRNDIENLFFAKENVEWKQVDQIFTWKKDHHIQKWCAEGVDLVVCETGRLSRFRSRVKYGFRHPILVRQVVPLPKDAHLLLHGKSHKTDRKKILRAEKAGYTYSVSKSPEDFVHFYHNLYVPYITERHGVRAKLTSFSEMLEIFKKGDLIQIWNGKSVEAAALVYQIKDVVYMTEYGKKALVAEDNVQVSLFTYWSTIRWAVSQGATKSELGGTFAWVSNGVFRNKKAWRSVVANYPILHNAWDFFTSEMPHEKMQSFNNIQFITRHKDYFYLVVAADQDAVLPKEIEQQLLFQAHHSGLNGFVLLKPFSKKVFECKSEKGAETDENSQEDEKPDELQPDIA